MIVISDTSPMNYLVLIGEVGILQKMFGKVVLPMAVVRELSHPRTPAAVRDWMQALPEWIEVRAAAHVQPIESLGDGELEAIALAEELHADVILLDDGDARDVAARRGLRVTGVLGMLESASAMGLINLEVTLATLRTRTTYRISQSLVAAAIRRDATRRRNEKT